VRAAGLAAGAAAFSTLHWQRLNLGRQKTIPLQHLRQQSLGLQPTAPLEQTVTAETTQHSRSIADQ
jgi:hypothetical protein